MKPEIFSNVQKQHVIYANYCMRGNTMIKKLSVTELEILLSERDAKQYISMLNDLRNVGNPKLAITEMDGYSIGQDIVVVSKFCFSGCQIYFEVSDTSHLQEVYNLAFEKRNDINEYLFSSDSNEIFTSPAFTKLFGKHDVFLSEQYAMLNLNYKNDDIDYHVRELREDDIDAICNFSEPYSQYHNNLRNAYETSVKNKDPFCKVYGYMDDSGAIQGYLIVNTFDRKYWDISYIYIEETMRRQGIAAKLS